jgi:poly(3-hydroxybutyrate) depolymerase
MSVNRMYLEKVNSRLAIAITFFALTGLNVFAQPPGYEDRYHDGMRYGLFVPPSYNPGSSYPLVIYLHGCNDTTSWDLQWYHDPIQASDPCFVLTPKTFKYVNECDAWGTSWYADHPEDMQNTIEVADSLIAVFNIDTSRLYIYGTSMGGFGVFSVLAKEPGTYAGAIAICGGGNPATASQVAQTPLWIFHGSADPVVPISQSKTLYQSMINSGASQVRFTEYPGVGHNSWDYALEEPSFYQWLLAQKKGTSHGNPDSVANLAGEAISSTSVEISWNSPSGKANPDNQVWYYNIYRDNAVIAEADCTDTVFLDRDLEASAKYSYKISAINLFFRESALSDSLVIETLPAGIYDSRIYRDGLAVTPNPATSFATLSMNLSRQVTVFLTLYSFNGQIAKTMCFNGLPSGKCELTVSFVGLPDGIYLVRLMAGDDLYTARLIIRNQ